MGNVLRKYSVKIVLLLSFILTILVGCGNKQECILLNNASPETSAMSFYYFDGDTTTVKWLFDSEAERKIIEEINQLNTKSVDCDFSDTTIVPCYGMEIGDKEGYEIWLTYCDGIWLLKDGTTYEAKYDFPSLYESIPDTDSDSWNSGMAMPNAAILGQADVRFYEKAQDLCAEKDGVSLTILSIDHSKVTIRLQNNTPDDFVYGEYYSLQREIDGQWYSLPVKLSNYGFNDIGWILASGNSSDMECDLTMYGELEEGHYRLEKEGMAADFFIQP